MKKLLGWIGFSGVIMVTALAHGKIIVVNTTNNISPTVGETNLVQAINLLADGDRIHFNIPGPGPFYLATPPLPDGYPAITRNNITIDGFTQPGAQPNTNGILAANNAQFQIVLDSRAGGGQLIGPQTSTLLVFLGAQNLNIRGVCLLGPGLGEGTSGNPFAYALTLVAGANGAHINGCQFGVALDGTHVHPFVTGIAALEYPSGVYLNNLTFGVSAAASDSAMARSQFNVSAGCYIPLLLEGENYRVSGNFINVLPDGLRDYNCDGVQGRTQALIEIGRRGNNVIIGTDGDGLNDAEERNLFGGVSAADDGKIIQWYGGSRTNTVIAGNYFGVAIDGVTRFTNSMKLFGGFNSSATARIGSDFDGVSDDLEGNLISMNYPFDELFPTPAIPGPPPFADVESGARVSLRGNRLLGNNSPVFSYADGTGLRLAAFTNFHAPYLETTPIIPILNADSSGTRLLGSCALGREPFTNVLIDVYLADWESWTNGQRFAFSELAYVDPVTSEAKHHGFAQGRAFLRSFVENGPEDLNPAPGQFEFNITALNITAEDLVTFAASYSADPPGTRHGRVHTGPFALPVILQTTPRLAVVMSGPNLHLAWPTNAGMFTIQARATLTTANWTNLNPQPALTVGGSHYQAFIPISGDQRFYRLTR